jgi:hypothetical protein
MKTGIKTRFDIIKSTITPTITPTIRETIIPTITETIVSTNMDFTQKFEPPPPISPTPSFTITPPPELPPPFMLPFDFGGGGLGIRRKLKKFKIPTRYTPTLVGTIFYPRIKKAPRDVQIAGIGIRPQVEGNVPKTPRIQAPKNMFERVLKSMFQRKPKNLEAEKMKKVYNQQFEKTVFGMDTRKVKKRR